jgi:hypothetical protein
MGFGDSAKETTTGIDRGTYQEPKTEKSRMRGAEVQIGNSG